MKLSIRPPRGPRLTRAGHFQLSSTGAIIDEQGNALLNATGQKLQTTPSDVTLTIAADGTLSSENGQIGKIGVVQAKDITKLTAEGGRLFALDTTTQPLASPHLVQGAVEDSNVQPIIEMNRMTTDMREFQFASQIIQGESDRLNGAIDKIMRKGT